MDNTPIVNVSNYTNDLISKNDVMIFGKSTCGCNSRAKKTMEFCKKPYHSIDIDKMPQGNDIHAHLQQLTGQRTLPSIFVKGNFIGGSDQLLDLLRSKKLYELLA